ncbi:DNA ligase D [Chryseobacterium salipaludis]|uniref:DNA ligase D n=1 Tax=Chryseobacterium TaxID=59732 RepID=UPI001FF67013|nr:MULTISPECIES: DNA ligase D [Chryseobacterium]MCJ8497808.1 DNA ligase D [Chryseobacterium salipaludis]MCX3296993.1 DNA ligase D [Planobacterium sp. JC490]
MKSLDEYNRKRRFDETPEPEGEKADAGGKLVFVVQRHSATRLHYDFRLEMDGVLKSWAVPKGPSLDPHDRRLAMMTEDHPYSYKDFEGSIPEGNYGGGEVEIWDHGTYEPIEPKAGKSDDLVMRHQLHCESLKFRMHGNKLKGEFALVKIKNGKDDNAWLLIKHKDEYAEEPYDAEDHTPKNSKVTERENARPSKRRKTVSKEKTTDPFKKKTAILPDGEKKVKDFIVPMLAQTASAPFDDPHWVFEIKWDGYRAIAEKRGESLLLYSRNGLSFLEKFGKVTEALQEQPQEMVVDGEIVVFNKEGKPDFQALQQIMDHPEAPVAYQVFDLLWLNGHSTENLTLLERKELLKEALVENEVIRYCEHVPEQGKEFYEQLEKMKLEGMMAKKANSTYAEGSRSADWLKVKFEKTEDVIICGFTEPKGSREMFGALILGTYRDGELVYCGHAGTGFSAAKLHDLYDCFKPLITDRLPFDKKPKTNTPATWLKPKLVCEIKYTEVTQDGIFRHPVFITLRKDKTVEDIRKTDTEVIQPDERKTLKRQSSMPDKKIEDGKLKAGKQEVKITHADKIYFPDDEITKGDVIEYYQSVSKYILPYLKDRPQSLHRFPNGIKGLSFYQKDAGDDAPSWMDTVSVHSESNDKDITYMICNTAADLAYLNNLGCIDINPWNATKQEPEHPTWLALDLDPSDKNSFDDVIETAQCVKEILDIAKIKGYPKTSGSTGIHIFIPMGAQYTADQVKDFALLLMERVMAKLPKITTLERNLKKRDPGKIYLDYLQNRTGQTLASVYSIRPRAHAPVSMPLEWDEVKKGLLPTDFTIANALDRIKEKGDLFKPVLGKGIDMLKALENLGAD